jgi:hypothetical protein
MGHGPEGHPLPLTIGKLMDVQVLICEQGTLYIEVNPQVEKLGLYKISEMVRHDVADGPTTIHPGKAGMIHRRVAKLPSPYEDFAKAAVPQCLREWENVRHLRPILMGFGHFQNMHCRYRGRHSWSS